MPRAGALADLLGQLALGGVERLLPLLVERLRPAADAWGVSYEVLCVDDGSTDTTPVILQRVRRTWPQVRVVRLRTNAGHQALAALDPGLLITQNVDGLHEAAGSRRLVALHGRVADVVCLTCRTTTSRAALERELDALNPGWLERHGWVESRPDGDVDLDDTHDFVVPRCPCGGPLKPDVVFFGENVPRRRVDRCHALLDDAEALLVLGSSLTVMSGFRFVRYARSLGMPVVIVNRGRTRNTVTLGGARASRLVLPVLAGATAQGTPLPPATALRGEPSRAYVAASNGG